MPTPARTMPMPDAPTSLRDQQFRLARYIRDPDTNPPPPGIEARRLHIYRDLFYNNIEGMLAGSFPVLRKVLGDARWHALIRAFMREHRCTTPLFPELSRELLRYLEARAEAGSDDPPFALELAHYEWVELALQIDEADPATIAHDPDADLLSGIPLPSPLAWALAYTWPVHRIGPDAIPTTPPAQPTFLLVRRGPDRKVHFSEINALTFRLLGRLSQYPQQTGAEHLTAIAVEAGATASEAFLQQGRQILAKLRAGDVLLGCRPQAKE